jgi:arginine repressor
MAQAKPEITKSQSIRNHLRKNPKANVKEVVSALADQGITVTENLVYGVKGKMEIKKQQKKAAKAAAAAPSSNGAASKATTKSSAVHSFLKGNRKMTAKEVVSALTEKGISVTEGLVYFVKGRMKGRRKKVKQMVAQVAATTAAATPNADAVKTILKVKGWAYEVGGMKKLKSLVDALSE